MTIYLIAVGIGVIAGLRTMTAPAAVSWAARLGLIHVEDTWLAFLGYAWTPWIFTALAVGELVGDQLPTTPSRTVPVQFGGRIVSGALAGAAVTASGGGWIGGAVAGAIGAIIGTLGGRAFRAQLARIFRSDPPAAFVEDAVAISGAILLMMAAR